MPDLGPAIGGLLEVFGPLLRVAVSTLLSSTIGLAVAAGGVLVESYWLGARHGQTSHGWLAVAASFVLLMIIAPILAVKRAVGRAVVHGLETLGLGRKLLSVLFDRIMGVEQEGAAGTRGSLAQRGLERLPLVEIERRLKSAVARITGEGEGFFAKRLRAALLDRVAAFTLEELRATGDDGGGVDLVLARQRLEETVDKKLVARAKAALTTTTVMLLALLLLGTLGMAWVIGR